MQSEFDKPLSWTDPRVALTTTAAIFYFLYLYLIIHTAITLDGACLYTFWLPYKDQIFSPYWISVSLVVLLAAWAAGGLVVSASKLKQRRWGVVYYLVAVVVLLWWLYSLWGFWRTMQYERGELSAEVYYDDSRVFLFGEPAQCRGI